MHIAYYFNMNMGMQYGYLLLSKKEIDSKTIFLTA